MNESALLFAVIVLSLLFTYTNGFQDGSAVTATAIACRALSPAKTVLLVSMIEFLGAWLGGSCVATSIQSIVTWPERTTLLPILTSGLVAAIAWNYLTRWSGLPSSSTHALVGSILGALLSEPHGWQHIVLGRFDHVINATGLWKIIVSLFLSPLAGFLAGYFLLLLMLFLLWRASARINETIKSLQVLTVGCLAFGHGANDTQKAMGLIVLALSAAGMNPSPTIPCWVRLLTGLAMAAGVASLPHGIVKRVGSDIFKVKPLTAFVSQLSSCAVIITSSFTGGPVSASQVIVASVMGVGFAERKKGVHWLIARDILIAWFVTIPGAALLASLIHHCLWHWFR